MTNSTMPSMNTMSSSTPPTSLPPTSTPPDSSSPPPTSSTPPSSSPTPTTPTSMSPSSTPTPTPSSTPTPTPTSTPTPTPTTPTRMTTFTTEKKTVTVPGTNGGGVTTKVITSTKPVSRPPVSHTHTHAQSTTQPASLVNSGGQSSDSSGLSDAGKVAIAVVIPVFVVALLIILGIFFWRKRKQKRIEEEARRKEIEDYGYNPNDDPTLPAVAGMNGSSHSPEMSEEVAGYRGWGNNSNAVASTNRKASTNLSSGMVVSDDGRGPSPGSPGRNTASDGDRSSDPLMSGIATGMGGVGVAQTTSQGNAIPAAGVARGPSNASSTYSATGQTENSEDGNHLPDYGYDNNYSQYAPYATGSAGYADGQQPIIRDVTARRNTKIENPTVYPQQGNSGIAQNF